MGTAPRGGTCPGTGATTKIAGWGLLQNPGENRAGRAWRGCVPWCSPSPKEWVGSHVVGFDLLGSRPTPNPTWGGETWPLHLLKGRDFQEQLHGVLGQPWVPYVAPWGLAARGAPLVLRSPTPATIWGGHRWWPREEVPWRRVGSAAKPAKWGWRCASKPKFPLPGAAPGGRGSQNHYPLG